MEEASPRELGTKGKAVVATLLALSQLAQPSLSLLAYEARAKPSDPGSHHHPSSKPHIRTPGNPDGRHIPRRIRRQQEKARLGRR